MILPTTLSSIAALTLSMVWAAPAPSTSRVLRVPTPEGHALHVVVRGSGASPVVLVPYDALLGPVVEEELAAVVEGGGTVVTWDMRGRGRSSRPDGGMAEAYSLAGELRDLDRVRAAVGAERVDLIGASYLGGVVALYAARNPERVRRLVLLGAIPPRGDIRAPAPPVDEDALARVGDLRESGAPSLRPLRYCRAWWDAVLPAYVGARERIADVRPVVEPTCALVNEAPDHVVAVAGAILGPLAERDWSDEARAVRAPTLVLHGTADAVAPLDGARAWVEALPSGRLHPVDGAGHLLWAEAADEVWGAVRSFMEAPTGG